MISKVTSWLFHNTTPVQTIIKNTFWLFSGQLVSRVLRAVIVIYAARVLGAGSWGAFSYAISIAAFLTVFSDIGINALITKEAARKSARKYRYLATAFFVKLALLVLLVVLVFVFLPYITNIPEAAMIMPILLLVFAFDTLRDLGSAVSRALEKMHIESLVGVFTNLAIMVLGFILLFAYRTSVALAWGYAIGSALGLIMILYVLRDSFKNLFSNFDRSLIKPILATAWPFGLLSIMGVINLNTDIVMLGWMRTPEEVGYYSAAQKIVLLFYVIPSLIGTSIFPLLARSAYSAPARARAVLERSVAFVIMLSIPLTVLGIFFAPFIINILFGAVYIPSVLTFQILMLTLLIVYPTTLIGNAIFAYDVQKSFVPFVITSAIGNVFFNILLIPFYGIEGAAISTIATQLITNTLIWSKMYSLNKFRPWLYLLRFWQR
jgi:O-antigen/teichoic acid export membrane protein